MWQIVGAEARVIAMVCAGILCAEVAINVNQKKLSIDIRHMENFPTLASEVKHAADPGACNVLCLGNSMTRHGINTDVLRMVGECESHCALDIVKIHPDNTRLAEWFYLYKNFFHEARQAPDIMLVGFQGTQLQDQPSQSLNRLARYYRCQPDDWSQLVQWDIRNFEDSCRYAASAVSAIYSHHDRFGRRVFSNIIPYYRQSSALINVRQPISVMSVSSLVSYERLKAFVALANNDGVRVVFIAMPIREKYQLEPELVEIIHELGAEIIDCQNVPSLTEDMIPDGIHLNGSGAVFYSDYLARTLPWSKWRNDVRSVELAVQPQEITRR